MCSIAVQRASLCACDVYFTFPNIYSYQDFKNVEEINTNYLASERFIPVPAESKERKMAAQYSGNPNQHYDARWATFDSLGLLHSFDGEPALVCWNIPENAKRISYVLRNDWSVWDVSCQLKYYNHGELTSIKNVDARVIIYKKIINLIVLVKVFIFLFFYTCSETNIYLFF